MKPKYLKFKNILTSPLNELNQVYIYKNRFFITILSNKKFSHNFIARDKFISNSVVLSFLWEKKRRQKNETNYDVLYVLFLMRWR